MQAEKTEDIVKKSSEVESSLIHSKKVSNTPPDFWQLDIPDTEELIARKVLLTENDPLPEHAVPKWMMKKKNEKPVWVEKTNAKKENQVVMEKTLQSAHNQFFLHDGITTVPVKEVFDESLIPSEIVSNHTLPLQTRQKGNLKRKKKTKEQTFTNELMHTKEAMESKQVFQASDLMHNRSRYSKIDIKKKCSPLKSYPDKVVILSDDSSEVECIELSSSDEDSEKLCIKKTEDNLLTFLDAENFENFDHKQAFFRQSKICQTQIKTEEYSGLAHLNDYIKKEPAIHSCFTSNPDFSETIQNKIGIQDSYTEISDSELSETILSPGMVCDVSIDDNDKSLLKCDEELYFTTKGAANLAENDATSLFPSKTGSQKFTLEYVVSDKMYENSFLNDCKLSTQNMIVPLSLNDNIFSSESGTENCTDKTQVQENIPRNIDVVKDYVLSPEEPDSLPNVNQVENSLIENLFAKTFNSEVSSLLINSSCDEISPIKHELSNLAHKTNMTNVYQKNQDIESDGNNVLLNEKDLLTKNIGDASVSNCNDQLSLANTVLIDTITPIMDSISNNELEPCQNDSSKEQSNLSCDKVLSSSSQLFLKDKSLVNEKVLNVPEPGYHSYTNEQKSIDCPNEMLKGSVNVIKKSKQHHLALQRNTALFLTKFNKTPKKKVENLEHHKENYLETSKNNLPLKINPTESEQSMSNCAEDAFLGSSGNKVTDESDYSYQSLINYNFEKDLTQVACSTKEFGSSQDNFLRGSSWSPDGQLILTNSNDNLLRVFKLPDDILECNSNHMDLRAFVRMPGGETVYSTDWYPFMNITIPDSCLFLSSSRDHPIHLWDAVTGDVKCSYRAFDQMDELTSALSVSFNADGSKIYAGFNNTVRIFESSRPGRDCIEISTVGKKGSRKKSRMQNGIVSCIDFPKRYNGCYALGSFARTVALYDCNTDETICVMQGHKGGVTQVQFTNDGCYLLSGGRKDNEILCWDMRSTSIPVFKLSREVTTNQRIQFDIDRSDSYVFTGNTNRSIAFYNLHHVFDSLKDDEYCFKPDKMFRAHGDVVNSVSLHPSLPLLVSTSGQRHFFVDDSSDSDSSGESPLAREVDNSMRIWVV